MKFSDYLNVEPTPKKVNQSVNIRDEHRETILEQKIVSLTAELTKVRNQTSEVEHLQRQNSNLKSDKRELVNKLDSTQSTLDATQSQLKNEFHLKQEIKALEKQLQTHQQHFEKLSTKSTDDARFILKQEQIIMELEAVKTTLESQYNQIRLQNKYAEQKQIDAVNELKYIRGQFKEVEESSTKLMEEYLLGQKELSSNIDQRRALRSQVRMLEEELEAGRSLNSSLHESVRSLQDFYDTSQNHLQYSEKTAITLDDTIKTLMHTLSSVEQENTYLIDKQKYLETELARPKYMSQSLIERREGFKMPLASGALNVRKNYLGTGKPTLLKFKKKELANDN